MILTTAAEIQGSFEGFRKAVSHDLEATTKHALAIVRKSAIESMEWAPKGVSSEPGTPPNRHTGKLGNSIRFKMLEGATGEVETSLWYAKIMEYGAGKIKKRAFLGPAADREAARIAALYAGSVTSVIDKANSQA